MKKNNKTFSLPRKMESKKRKLDNDNTTVFVLTLTRNNKDHDVIGVFLTKLLAMHAILTSDEMYERCKDLDVDDVLFVQYATYILHDFTEEFLTEQCEALYNALKERFESKEDCFYCFRIYEKIISR